MDKKSVRRITEIIKYKFNRYYGIAHPDRRSDYQLDSDKEGTRNTHTHQ
jgi:hypothetical protein